MTQQGMNVRECISYGKTKISLWFTTGLVTFAMASLPNEIAVAKSSLVYGSYGQLMVSGELTLGTCEVELSSLYQNIDLGQINRMQLQAFGDQSAAAFFSIKFSACGLGSSLRQDVNTGNSYFDPLQPIVSVKFMAPARKGNPELIQVNGNNGVALRIYDAQHKSVVLGQIGTPQFLGATNQQLEYSVVLERTADPLTKGEFSAVTDFVLFYE